MNQPTFGGEFLLESCVILARSTLTLTLNKLSEKLDGIVKPFSKNDWVCQYLDKVYY